jgi:LacY proton/sugar symporter
MTTSVIQRYFGGLSRNTFLLAYSSLFADISTEMLYPVLPVFLTQVLHATGSIVGLIGGFAQATQNIVQGFSGALSDKLQKRKSIALCGYLLAAIAKPLIASGCGPIRLLRIVFGNLSRRRQGVCFRFRPPATAGERCRLVQHYGRVAATRGQRRRRPAVGSNRSCVRVLLRRGLRRRRQRRTIALDSG